MIDAEINLICMKFQVNFDWKLIIIWISSSFILKLT